MIVLGDGKDFDIRFQGKYDTIWDVWKVYPRGGCIGQYVLIGPQEERWEWDEWNNRWTNGDPEDPPHPRQEGVVKKGDIYTDGTITGSNLVARYDVRAERDLEVKNQARVNRMKVSGLAELDGKTMASDLEMWGDIHTPEFMPGVSGYRIDGLGNMEARSLRLREFLEVPELRKNRITVTGGEFWVTDSGIVKEVERVRQEGVYEYTYRVRLKLEEKDVSPFRAGDILKGIYHRDTGFQTTYLEVVREWEDGQGFDCMRIFGQIVGASLGPEPFMTLARIGNTGNTERQGSIRINGSGKFIQVLSGVSTPDITSDNIRMMLGDLKGVYNPAMGPVKGYGAYLENVYASGRFVQRSGDGITESAMTVWKGEWNGEVRYYAFDLVCYKGSNYVCVKTLNAGLNNPSPDIDRDHWQLYTSRGEDGVTIRLVPPSMEIPCEADGSNPRIEGVEAEVLAWKGEHALSYEKGDFQVRLMDDYSGAAYRLEGNRLKVTNVALGVDKGYANLSVMYGGRVYREKFTWTLCKKGDKGDPGADGAPGERGPQGATIRMRGEWKPSPDPAYTSNSQWRDVVLYDSNHYIVKLGLTVPQGSGAPAVTPTYWEAFNEFENVSTRVLLAGQGRIDVLGAGELFVGESGQDGGWRMTRGAIRHTESGLALDAQGHLYIPQGGFSIGERSGEDYIRDQVPYVGGNLVRHSGGYQQESPWPEIRRVWNNQTLLYAVMPNTDLSCMYARQEGRVNFIQDDIQVRAGVKYTLSFRVCVYVAEGAVKYPPFRLVAFQRAGAGAPEEQIMTDTSVRDHIAGDEYVHTYPIVPKYTGGLKLFFYVVVDGYDQTLPPGSQDWVALWMGNIKLEEGEKATAWVPAFQDAQDGTRRVMEEVERITADDVFTSQEKKRLLPEWDSIVAENPLLGPRADQYGLTAEKNAYQDAYTPLYHYVNPLMVKPDTDSPGDGAVFTGDRFREVFTAFYTARTALYQALDAQAGILVDGLEIGGRNLFLKSEDRVCDNQSTRWYMQRNAVESERPLPFGFERLRGRDLTLSFDLEIKDIPLFVSLPGTVYRVGVQLYAVFQDGSVLNFFPHKEILGGMKDYSGRMSGTYRVPDKPLKSDPVEANCYLAIANDMYGVPSLAIRPMSIKISHIKLEFGTKATDWSLAPEDQVSRDHVVSSINLSREAIKIQADRIELSGEVIAAGITGPNGTALNLNGNFLIDRQGNFTANSGVINEGVTVRGKLEATQGKIGGFDIGERAILANDEQNRLRLRLTQDPIPSLDQMQQEKITWIGDAYSNLSNRHSQTVRLSEGLMAISVTSLISDEFTVQDASQLECMVDYSGEVSVEINPDQSPVATPLPKGSFGVTVFLERVETGEQVTLLERNSPARETGVHIRRDIGSGRYRIKVFLMNTGSYKAGTPGMPLSITAATSASLYIANDLDGDLRQGKVVRYSNYSVIGRNGLASVWDQRRYFYLSQDGDCLLQSRGVQRLMSPDSRSGVVVRDGGVKIVEGGKELPAAPVIGGGRVSTSGEISEKVGSLNMRPSQPANGVITITHDFGSANYIVMLTIDGAIDGNQDNTISLVEKTSVSFKVKGRNCSNGVNEATPFYFTMIRIG